MLRAALLQHALQSSAPLWAASRGLASKAKNLLGRAKKSGNLMQRGARGLFGGKLIQFGNQKSFAENKCAAGARASPPNATCAAAELTRARRDRVAAIEDPVLRVAAAAELERDLERFLEYQASASAALVTYEELNEELDSILQVLAGEPCVDALTEAALDLRNQAWSLRMILEDCERAAVAFESR